MKYTLAAAMLLCLLGMATATIMGITYLTDGVGLHPAIAATTAVLFLCAGGYASYLMDVLDSRDY